MTVFELNMDGLVGPTHHYAGLAPGNIASTNNAKSSSRPKAAALQGLQKMRLLHSLGLKQGVIPPQQRPNLHLLHQLGFQGSPIQQITKAAKIAPELLSACYSSSSMWTANAATISPSSDTADNKVHFTAANLITNLHRQQEAAFSSKILDTIFSNPNYFTHHPSLPSSNTTSDEGAANHNRLCQNHASSGVHLFVYGKQGLLKEQALGPHKYPARQTLEAFEAIARNHKINLDKIVFAQQNPQVIDQGVFHNDVISVGNESLFLVHELAFCDQKKILSELKNKADFPLTIIECPASSISITEVVNSYLYNSQLITLPSNQGMMLLAPSECQSIQSVKTNPINHLHFIDLKQSMQNGGGPACLRLRIPLKEDELKAMHQGVLVDNTLMDKLEVWIGTHYREEIQACDLADPHLMNESLQALDELSSILSLGSIYPFQSEKTL
jgi:succinylarginine dihydrolase